MKTALLMASLLNAAAVSAEITPLMVGQPIPAGALTTAEGNPFDLKAIAKEQPLAIIFYRGGWCPYCNRHLAQLQKIDPELRELGYRIVGISPDKPEESVKSAAKGELNYTLLSDSTMAVAKSFGLAFTVDDKTLEKYAGYGIDLEAASGEKHHMLPVPAVFLVGTDGLIDFVYANPDYKTRLAPEVLLAAAKAIVKADENK